MSTAPAANRATPRRRGGRGADGRVGVSCSVVDIASPPGVRLTPLPQEHGPGGSRCDTATGTRCTRFGYRTATAPGQTPGLARFDGIPSSAPLGDQCLWRGTTSSQAGQAYRPVTYGCGSWRGTRTPNLLFTRQARIIHGVLARALLAAHVR